MNSKPKYRQSKQRDKILQILRSTSIHPTAAWIYEQLREEYPSLSLGNVYRNLNILVEQGEILELKFGSTFDRYCANVNPHYHFICESCGSIADLDMPIEVRLNQDVEQATRYKVNKHRLEFYGICEDCLNS